MRFVLPAAGILAACVCFGSVSVSAAGPEAGAFNPYVQKTFPSSFTPKGKSAQILQALGGEPQSILTDTAYRPHNREELYPVLFGDRRAPHEFLVFLDFSEPSSATVWKAVRKAMSSLSPSQAKVVLLAGNREPYGMDMTGLVIWTSYSRSPEQAADCLTWALDRWNEVKSRQKKAGKVRRFVTEYDAVAEPTDDPMVFQGMSRLNPPVSESQQCDVAQYVYDAGNVNLFQESEAAKYYRVNRLPAVVVDGRVLSSPSAGAITSAVK